MTDREKLLLLELLKLYPLVPDDRERLHPNSKPDEGSRKLLREALADSRQEAKSEMQRLIDGDGRWVRDGEKWRLALSSGDLETLLQALNDVRVGSWIRLGSPDPSAEKKIQITSQNAHHFWALEICGHYQTVILAGLSGSPGDANPDS